MKTRPLFLTLVLVITANNSILCLIVWETMSVASYLLVVYENRKDGTVLAGHTYLVMTHLGTALIMAGFLLMAQYAGSYSFQSYLGVGGAMPSTTATVVFLSCSWASEPRRVSSPCMSGSPWPIRPLRATYRPSCPG